MRDRTELLSASDAQIDDVLDYICAQREHHRIFYLWRPVMKDPDDDFLLELAVKSQASIVTWNVADFKKASTLGVQVITPRQLLNQLENPQRAPLAFACLTRCTAWPKPWPARTMCR